MITWLNWIVTPTQAAKIYVEQHGTNSSDEFFGEHNLAGFNWDTPKEYEALRVAFAKQERRLAKFMQSPAYHRDLPEAKCLHCRTAKNPGAYEDDGFTND